jgi:hypothetical protein
MRYSHALKVERLLRQVLGLLEGPEHPVAVDLQLGPVALDQARERGLIARLSGGDGSVDFLCALRNRDHAQYDGRAAEKSSQPARWAPSSAGGAARPAAGRARAVWEAWSVGS